MPNNPFKKSFQEAMPSKIDPASLDNYERAGLQGRPLQMPSREMGRNMRDLKKVNVGFRPQQEFDPSQSVPEPFFDLTNQMPNTSNRDVTESLENKYLERMRVFRNNPFARKAEQTDLRPFANKYKGER